MLKRRTRAPKTKENMVMYFRQIAVATALFAMLALAGMTADVPPLDVGIDDGPRESSPAYSFDPDVITLMEEGIVP
ncbi:MAG: hypothetical protein CMM60_02785 [Rhodospirillaceae bacterium]|nr:hypothetical protein [Rhodospirillaceae bacterium]